MKKITTILLSLALSFSLVGCSSKSSEDSSSGLVKITVAASPSPHAEILENLVEPMKEKGYELVIQEFDDYVLPNTAVENGEVDANYFQHQPYLDDFNAENDTHIVSVAKVHFEPLGFYAGGDSAVEEVTLDSIKEGAKIAIPDDNTNQGRALLLCEALGLIEVDDAAGFTATPDDITSNPKNLVFEPITAQTVPSLLPDVDYAVINGNYALSAKVTDKLIVTEDKDSDAAQTYANILAVKEGNENNEAIQALVELLLSDTTADYINDTYEGVVVPVF